MFPVDADVWGTSLGVTGEITGAFIATHCDVAIGYVSRAARVAGGGFYADLTLAPGPNVVRGRCFDAQGRILDSEPRTYSKRSLREAQEKEETDSAGASWLDDAVLYGILPPLYGTPPLVAAREALPALVELGVNALWLAPVMATPPGNFGYAVTDYFAVRKDYGTTSDLRSFVNRAHTLGLRVIFDFVPNHTSDKHPYFEQAERFRERSHYFHFYMRDPSGNSEHYFDWKDLPNLDYSNPEVQVFITAASQSWLEDFGNDGYRVDAAWGIAQRRPGFFATWARRMRAARPGAVLIAEASARDSYYGRHGFDAAYDWTGELGHWAWGDAFASDEDVAPRLRNALTEALRSNEQMDRVVRFLNNNDTGARFVKRHGVGLTRAATVLLLTLPGIPCLYSLDEIGGEFEPYAGLGTFAGPTHPELRPWYRSLISLRHRFAALHGPGIEVLDVSSPAVLAYLRSTRDDSEHALVLINFSAALQTVSPRRPLPLRGKVLRRLGESEIRLRATEVFPLELPPFGYAMVVDEAASVGTRN